MARRVLVLAVVVAAVALLGASTSGLSSAPLNDTGLTATAVTVTFDQQVRITSYDQSVFTTEDPVGRATSFRFSGGELENGMRFSMSWSPSDAEITDVQWETTTGPTGTAGTGTSAGPLTYDQIMAQIAHYPGPDEPLYQPKADEQIWLTDLDGHADIYDNDSIKINYAPGFDKSQITRIEVYRNGVKMRFLPALFDALSNEQMKTFDGNPEEHSPASSHTDHAIMGYTYEFRFATSSSLLALTPASATVKSGIIYDGEIWIFVGGDAWRALDMLSDASLKASLKKTAEFADGVVLRTTYFLLNDASDGVVPLYVQEPGVTPDWARTLTRDEMLRFLRISRELQIPVEVGVEVWESESYAAAHPGWGRGSFTPRDVNAWFRNYTAICVENARIAQEGGAVMFCPFVEMNCLAQYPEKIAEVGAAVKQVFTGRLDFDEATNQYLMGFNAYNGETRLDRNAVQLSRDYDVLGMNWWDITGLDSTADQRYSVIVGNAVKFWAPAFSLHRARHPWVEIDFGEVGSRNIDGGILGWDERIATDPWSLAYDYQESSDLLGAIVDTAAYYGVGRIVAWTYLLQCIPEDCLFRPGTHAINGTEVTRILEAFRATK